MLSKKVIKTLEDNRIRRLNGDVVAIPYPFKRVSEYLPGIEQGKYFIVTSAQKGAKSQFTNFTFVFSVVDWYIENKYNTDIKPNIKVFSLEVSRDLYILSAISYKLFNKYGIIISPQKLKSVFQNYILDIDILNIIKSVEFQLWLKEFEDIVEIIDDVRNPTGIAKNVISYAESNGEYEYGEIDWEEKGIKTKKRVKTSYTANNENEFVIIITDHIGLLTTESGMTLHETMSKYSSEYCLLFRDRFNYTIINVQQQSASGQSAAYDYKGQLVLNKVKPTPYDLADNRLTARDCNLMFGLFYPYYYDIYNYNGIDLNKVGNNHRELSILLNRDGLSNLSLDLMFLGAANHFREFPININENVYRKVEDFIRKEI